MKTSLAEAGLVFLLPLIVVQILLTIVIPLFILLLPFVFQIAWTKRRLKHQSELAIGMIYFLTLALISTAALLAYWIYDYGYSLANLNPSTALFLFYVGATSIGASIATLIGFIGIIAYYLNQNKN